jgi:23S rRNA pseudouridine2605 synthase
MTCRLQKRIAESGLMSRRAAEEAIRAGRVTVNGRQAVLGESCSDTDSVLVDGRPIPAAEDKQYYMLNKPRGYVCSLHDEKGRRSVRELLPKSAGRLYPVGRLDIMSEGLLLMTNDGELTLRLTHPSGQVLKTYRTTVGSGDLAVNFEKCLSRLHRPFVLNDTEVCAKSVEVISRSDDTAVLDITVGEGRNREIRRMCEALGLEVARLRRTQIGGVKMGMLKQGDWRDLTEKEVKNLLANPLVNGRVI